MSLALVHLDFEVFAPLDVRNSPKLVPDLLSWACALLQSLPSFEPPLPRHTICTASLRLRHPPLRFSPLQRFPARDSGFLICQAYLTQQPASSGFLDPPMLSSATYLLALFHARSTHGVAPSRASLLPHGRASFPSPSTLMSFQSTPSTSPTNPCSAASCFTQIRHTSWLPEHPRLQGLAPCKSPPRSTGGLDLHWRVALLGFASSRVFSHSRKDLGFHRVSPHEVTDPASKLSRPTLLQGLASESDRHRLLRDRLPSWTS